MNDVEGDPVVLPRTATSREFDALLVASPRADVPEPITNIELPSTGTVPEIVLSGHTLDVSEATTTEGLPTRS